MVSRSAFMLLALATCLFIAEAAGAQGTEIRGTVQRVDVASHTVYFTDGRAVTLEPDARLFVNGREVTLADVQPGWTLVTAGTTGATVPPMPGVVVAQPAAPRAAAPAVEPPIDATGVVASVDTRTGTVTLADGRVLHVTPRSTLWQPVPVGSLTPGTEVYVREAEPIDFRPPDAAQRSGTSPRHLMGTVSSVDPAAARVVLQDGTTVHLRPGGEADFKGQGLALTDLRPGDEVVVALAPGATTSSSAAVSALPRATVQGVDADSIHVVQRPPAR